MNGNISREGITADLEAMQAVGLGGAQIFNADINIPEGPVKFMSPEWRALFKHAAAEADRLGLELCVNNCAGWANSGGPWNTPANAMQRLVTSEVLVKGPGRFNGVLPRPPANLNYYRDIAVLAFPAPVSELTAGSAAPAKASASIPGDAAVLLDGRRETTLTFPPLDPKEPQYAQLEFPRPASARSIRLVPGPRMRNCGGVVQVSDDGSTFRNLQSFEFGRLAGNYVTVPLGDSAIAARYWRFLFNRAAGSKPLPDLAEIILSARFEIENLDEKTGFTAERAVVSGRALPVRAEDVIRQNAITDLTAGLSADGRLIWDVPAGDWVILRTGHTPSGINNHPAPKEGTGLECDKLSRSAMDAHWAGFMQKILEDLGPLAGKSLNNALIDSYEVGGQNWTENFRGEFRLRRGYDLQPFLPVFSGRFVESAEVTERFLLDMRRTIAELFAENYYGRFAELCRQNNLLASIEPYRGPFEPLLSGKPADIVMGEFWNGIKGNPSLKLATSVAHIYGKRLVGAEAFTTARNLDRWQSEPRALKMQGDAVFCLGINRFIFHRYAMQPWADRWPGMTMGPYGFHFERTNTWWRQSRAWIQYNTRCQFLLQQGRYVADVASFIGENALQLPEFDPKLPPGFNYDGVNADVLLNHASVLNGQLVLHSGMSYRVLALPKAERAITPRLLRQLRGFVAAGLTLVGPPPEQALGLEGFPGSDREVMSLVAELWGNCDGQHVTENRLDKGRVVWGQTLPQVLASLGVPWDFEYPANDGSLAFTHRIDGEADIYFVSNQSDRFRAVACTFRISGKQPEIWQPESGRVEQAPVWREDDGRITVPLQFDPAGSVFVVFRNKAGAGDHLVAATYAAGPALGLDEPPVFGLEAGTNGAVKLRASAPGTAELIAASGRTRKITVEKVPAPVEVSGPWALRFPPKWGAPVELELPRLISWPDHLDSGVKYFSGTATYHREIVLPAELFARGLRVWLNLGAVKNIAEVFVNGKPLGVLWKPPFRMEITGGARPGKNQLEIKITNLWPNRLIGDEQLPPDCELEANGALKRWPQWLLEGKPSPTGRLTFTTTHFWKKDDKLLPSGLLGPVIITSEVTIPVH